MTVAVLLALAAAVARRPLLASAALVVEAGFVVAWIVIGGFSSMDCVLGA